MREPGLRRLARLAFAAALAGSTATAAPLPIDRHALVDRHHAGAAGLRHRVAALGRQRRARLHRRRDRPPDLRRGLRRDDPARHALAVGLAHRAQPGRLDDRPLPLHGVRRARSRGRLRRHSRRPADARDRVAARQPAPAAPRPHRLPPHPPRRARGDAPTISPTSSRRSTCGTASCAAASGSTASRSTVETLCHPAPRPRRGARRLAARPAAGGSPSASASPTARAAATAADWTRPEAHETRIVRQAPTSAALDRRLDDDRYHVRLAWAPAAALAEEARHAFVLERPGHGDESLEAVIAFSPTPATRAAARLRRDPPGGAGALEPLLVDGRGDRPLRAAATRAGASSSGGSSSRSTSPRSSAPGASRRRRRG